jgi:dolichyl-phosphate-mannose--protein O-mannosyl transferase
MQIRSIMPLFYVMQLFFQFQIIKSLGNIVFSEIKFGRYESRIQHSWMSHLCITGRDKKNKRRKT